MLQVRLRAAAQPEATRGEGDLARLHLAPLGLAQRRPAGGAPDSGAADANARLSQINQPARGQVRAFQRRPAESGQ